MRSRRADPAPPDNESSKPNTHNFINYNAAFGGWNSESNAFGGTIGMVPVTATGNGIANNSSGTGTWHPPSYLSSTSTTTTRPRSGSLMSASSNTPITGTDRRSKKVSKRRKKKPKDKPKRPLSAYNIFFRDERLLILNAIDGQTDKKQACTRQVQAEQKNDDDMLMFLSPMYSVFDSGSEALFPALDEEELKTILTPSVTSESSTSGQPQSNKKVPHGKISFEDLAKVIGGRWKKLSRQRIAYYKDLAEKDAERYRIQMEEYNKKIADSKKLKSDHESSSATATQEEPMVVGKEVEKVDVPLVLEELTGKDQENQKAFDDFSYIFSNCPSPVMKEIVQPEIASTPSRNEEYVEVVLDAQDPAIMNYPVVVDEPIPIPLERPKAKKAKVRQQTKKVAKPPKISRQEENEPHQQPRVQNTIQGPAYCSPMYNNVPVYSFGQGFNPFQCMTPTMGGMTPTMGGMCNNMAPAMGGVMNYPMMMPAAHQQHPAPMMMPVQHMGSSNQSFSMMDHHGNTKVFHLEYAAVPVPSQPSQQMPGYGVAPPM